MQKYFVLFALAGLASCRGSDSPSTPPPPLPTIAATSDIRFDGSDEGVTPFISIVHLAGQRVPAIQSLSYVIEPKPGSVSKPVRVSYTLQALKSQGRLETNRLLLLPVFGLYAGFDNSVSIELRFSDGSAQTIPFTLTTDTYVDPNGIYDNPVFLKTRAAGSELGFDFFAMKSNLGTPVIVDTDGALRWVATGTLSGFASVFSDNGFVIGDQRSIRTFRLELDGTETAVPLTAPTWKNYHHNIDPGRSGYLAEVDTFTDIESTIAEFTVADGVIKEWDFAAIVGDYMRGAGDDPSQFVRHGVDWFHSNAATYDPRDDSLIVSSRESFVIKVDYDTGEIIWILGDPTKFWWTYPSLRAKALTLSSPGLYPIGQHATSITSDGLLLLFNDGFQSLNVPAGAPRGEARTYSAVSAYRIDPVTRTATEAWSFDYGRTIFSPICSSAYEGANQSVLISYAWGTGGTKARLVGLDRQHAVVFDFEYVNNPIGCDTSWNAIPVPLDNMSFQ